MADRKKTSKNQSHEDANKDKHEDAQQRQEGNLGGSQERNANDDSVMDDMGNAWDDLKEDADAF